MFLCPGCGSRLVRVRGPQGHSWRCTGCASRAAKVSHLRHALDRDQVNRVWSVSFETGRRGRPCPFCRRAMTPVPTTLDGGELELDVCKLCQTVWFDPGEFRFGAGDLPEETPLRDLPEEAKLAAVQLELRRVKSRAESENAADPTPDNIWRAIPAALGFPAEFDDRPLGRRPIVTWLIGAGMVLITILGLFAPDRAISDFGWIPAEPLRRGGLTLLSSFFLHGSILHLLGNLYFLLVFGDDVEDWLGTTRYVLLILLGDLVGNLLHVIVAPDSTIPTVGASGGISAIIAFYAAVLPRARIGLIILPQYYALYRHRRHELVLPAWFLFVLWLLYQLVLAALQFAGVGTISAGAHLGGAVVGLAMAWLLRE